MVASNTILQNRYLVLRLLAQGGMGAVYEARDQRLGNIVALKETYFTEESLRRAFHREASLLATLRHPALPKVIDHFSEGDGQFLVMEFIRGDDLAKILEMSGRPLAQTDVLNWGDQLLAALEYLHSQRPPIIHRDIKPQNLKLNERAEIILLDFGLAKEAALESSQLHHSVRGYTLKYAPLEQIQGTGTDPRSDLYSAAATIYHLLSALPPPDALERVAAMVEGKSDPLLPVHQVNPKVSAEVSAVLQQALALDRNRRPPNASAFRQALRQAIGERESENRPQIAAPTTRLMVEEATLPKTVANAPKLSAPTIAESPVINTATKRSNDAPAEDHKPGMFDANRLPAQPLAQTRSKSWIAVAVAVLVLAGIAAFLFLSKQGRTGDKNDVTTNTESGSSAVKGSAGIIPISSREIIAAGEGQERNYSFTALPGDLKFTLDVIGEGSTVTVEAFNADGQELKFNGNSSSLLRSSTGTDEQSVAHLLIDREQQVRLRVQTSYPQSLKAFRLRIDGQAKLPDSLPANRSPLASLFANRDQPLSLPANVVYAGRNPKKEIYYALNAGPGEVKVTLNVIGNGSTVEVELFDEEAQQLRFNNNSSTLSLASVEWNEQESAQILLDRQQKLLMRLHTSYPDSLRALRLKLDGAVQSAGQGNNNDPVAAALAPLFAPRDTPEVFRGKELTGSRTGKETYFRLTAGPGQLKVGLEVEGNGCTVNVELFDGEAKRLPLDSGSTTLSVASTGAKEHKRAEVNLAREEVLLLRLTANYPDSLKKFKLSLDGAFKKE